MVASSRMTKAMTLVLYGMAVVLFVITIAINLIATAVVNRSIQKSQGAR